MIVQQHLQGDNTGLIPAPPSLRPWGMSLTYSEKQILFQFSAWRAQAIECDKAWLQSVLLYQWLSLLSLSLLSLSL